ncbi:MAG TPA: class I SAM-dependent methyltransferase [Leptolyngbyaceae cyanobacterium M65_K2018_010]|nr:class I SAM-dependent methyltransferase [Leptolyngbyaceae cyanobacterium M65_K2018_010]
MATQPKTLFEQFLAPLFERLIDREALIRLRDSIDWPTQIDAFTDPQVVYPEYYTTSNFHGIPKGYLNIDAALTYDPITQYVLPPGETWVRGSLVQAVQGSPRRLLDLGCGTGSTTLMLKRRFPQAEVIGLDLSPPMLVMAAHKARVANLEVTFRHGNALATSFPDASFDGVCATLLFHETPPAVAKAILQESFRLLSPGGQVLILDGNQRTLRATDWLNTVFEEPFIRAYAQGNVDAWLGLAGFERVRTEDVFWLNQLSYGLKPRSVAEPTPTEPPQDWAEWENPYPGAGPLPQPA